MKPTEKLEHRITTTNSLVCVGLDSDYHKLPPRFLEMDQPQFEFNTWIIDQTYEYVCAYKPNMAFYEARGEQGWRDLRLTMEYLHEHHPDIFTICDAKRADIGSTNLGYVEAIFDQFGFDAITLHPYLGKEALAPFLERTDKVSIILCRTSNPGSGEIQSLHTKYETRNSKLEISHVWQFVAAQVAGEWNAQDNCMLVMGATYPEELKQVREIVGDMTLLVPGIGAQGGDVKETVSSGLNSKNAGMIINSSRGVIFSEDPRAETSKLRDEINKYRRP